jgi:Cytochrome c
MKTALTVTGALLVALAVARPYAQQPPARLALEVQDYATLPITADNTNTNTRGQLARVNFMREEPGGRRFFVNDLNGPLYILDKQKKTFTTYLDFKAGMAISIIEEQKGKQPPDLTDAQWDNGSNDGDIYAVIKRGLPPTMMAGYDGRIPDDEIWSIVNYLRTLPPKQ